LRLCARNRRTAPTRCFPTDPRTQSACSLATKTVAGLDHSSSSSTPGFGAGPFLAPASLTARRFSMTRWRISANIAGLSLMNALAFSRPWPMRVVL